MQGPSLHQKLTEERKREREKEKKSLSTYVEAMISQLFGRLRDSATFVIMKARPRLTVDERDELVELFSEHTKCPVFIVYSENKDETIRIGWFQPLM